ncbi:unnamed protein product [Echinostoma caproni]|uniref:Uncharacterized protein n=1 Tax=Echinostoma caproni TaxID=27848 RepID=A0A183AYZ8_9TREM|nr:unnamed protein product [Echinostoma caproni]
MQSDLILIHIRLFNFPVPYMLSEFDSFVNDGATNPSDVSIRNPDVQSAGDAGASSAVPLLAPGIPGPRDDDSREKDVKLIDF